MRTKNLLPILRTHQVTISNQTAHSIQIEVSGVYVAQEIYYRALQLGYSGYYREYCVVLFDRQGGKHGKN